MNKKFVLFIIMDLVYYNFIGKKSEGILLEFI